MCSFAVESMALFCGRKRGFHSQGLGAAGCAPSPGQGPCHLTPSKLWVCLILGPERAQVCPSLGPARGEGIVSRAFTPLKPGV